MRRDISGENYIRLSSESPTNPQFYTSIFKTLGSLYHRDGLEERCSLENIC